jgi:hypothetical protein
MPGVAGWAGGDASQHGPPRRSEKLLAGEQRRADTVHRPPADGPRQPEPQRGQRWAELASAQAGRCYSAGVGAAPVGSGSVVTPAVDSTPADVSPVGETALDGRKAATHCSASALPLALNTLSAR